MAAFFIDLDGTVFRYHTCEWLPGVQERLLGWDKEGHDLVFITRRDQDRDANTPYSLDLTRAALDTLLPQRHLITDVQTPRILIDDSPCFAWTTPRDSGVWLVPPADESA